MLAKERGTERLAAVGSVFSTVVRSLKSEEIYVNSALQVGASATANLHTLMTISARHRQMATCAVDQTYALILTRI
jgi:hypothetical protein